MSECTILAMVLATSVPNPKAATKLNRAAQATACIGVRTRVETTVAMEFAASFIPFRKSNRRAITMTRTTMVIMGCRLRGPTAPPPASGPPPPLPRMPGGRCPPPRLKGW